MTEQNSTLDAAVAADRQARLNTIRRRRGFLLLALAIVLAASGAALYWLLLGRFHEHTDDAYVAGNLVQVTPQIAGTVVSIAADQTDRIEQGALLVRLNDVDAELAVTRAEAELGKAVRDVRKLFASIAQYEASAEIGALALRRARTDLTRRRDLDEAGALTAEELQHARETQSGSEAGLALVRAQLAGSRALVDNTSIEAHPDVVAAATALRAAMLAQKRTLIPSPVSGYIAKRAVQLGQHVNAGQALLAVVPVQEMWVEANFKEGQLRRLRIGQPVQVRADLYGDAVTYRGSVIGLGLGTGSAFALLPAQNATGNWIKVVQRVPVRIALDAEQLRQFPLRVGLSMQVTVDTHQQDAPVLAQSSRAAPAYHTPVYEQELHEADLRVEKVIRANLGRDVSQHAAGLSSR